MKKIILSAALVLAFSTYTAAQKTTSNKAEKKAERKEVKKGTNKLVSTTSHPAKNDSAEIPLKIAVALPKADTSHGLPLVKQKND